MQGDNDTFESSAKSAVDPNRILESIVNELELLQTMTPLSGQHELVDLHAALLVYELAGDKALLPNTSFSLSPRRVLEARVVRAARRLVQAGGESNRSKELAAQQIEELVHLIDPELQIMAALRHEVA